MCPAEGEGGSERKEKLHRGVRVFASKYLQDNLFMLPSLPTAEQLAQIREEREREAKQRIQELERERERRRQLEAAERARQAQQSWRHVEVGVEEEEPNEEGPQPRLDGGIAKLEEKVNKIGDSVSDGLGKIFRRPGKASRVGFSKEGGAEAVALPARGRLNSGSGWIGESLAKQSVDSQEDPFVLQREQLLSYIQQAREAGRLDEVCALEASLKEIEHMMHQQELSYGFGSSD